MEGLGVLAGRLGIQEFFAEWRVTERAADEPCTAMRQKNHSNEAGQHALSSFAHRNYCMTSTVTFTTLDILQTDACAWWTRQTRSKGDLRTRLWTFIICW
jgi:hypothetical protein